MFTVPSAARTDENVLFDEESYSTIPAEHQHCLRCIDSKCRYDNCAIVCCKLCNISLHGCKLDDHIIICQKSPSNCPNTSYGCTAIIRRDKISQHLTHCPAGLIICPWNWYRKILPCSLEVQSEENEIKLCELEEIDVQMALRDQNIWSSGGERSNMQNKKISSSRKVKSPFDGCRLCRLDPSSQHLHVLGNMEGSERGIVVEKKKKSPNIAPFFKSKNLLVNLDYYSFNRVEGIRIDGSEFFAHNCSTLMRRDETDGHFLFHNVYSTVHGEMVHRCPLWQYGCEFFAFRLYPRCSRIRYNEFLREFVYESRIEEEPPADESIDNIIQLIYVLEPYLESATLNCLSATNSRIRHAMFTRLASRCVVEPAWEKVSPAKWRIKNFKRLFTSVQSPVKYELNMSSNLIANHLQKCTLNIKKDFGELTRVKVMNLTEKENVI